LLFFDGLKWLLEKTNSKLLKLAVRMKMRKEQVYQ